jgi:hypothetical protein
MNHMKILKRAFNITVNYRVLWIFGILLALTSGGGGGNGGGGGGGNGSSGGGNNPGFNGQPPFGNIPQITPAMTGTIVSLAIGFACLILALVVILNIVRYVSETAMIRMVDQYENDGEKLGFRQGFKLGWSRAAWKMFLMDLLITISFLAVLVVLLAVAALPLLVFLVKDVVPLHIVGGVISAGLLLLLIFAAIMVGLALSLVLLFARRVIVLENLGVRASLQRAFTIVKQRLGDVILMGVMMFGVGLAWTLVTIPVILAVIVAAALAGGLPALLVGSITAMFAQGAIPWIVAAIIGVPIFLLVIIIPGSLLGGWQKVYSSSAWTLAYRETIAMEKINGNGDLPVVEAA